MNDDSSQSDSTTLDPTTKASLSRLATLIRGQMKETDSAAEASEREAELAEAEAKAREVRTERALKTVQNAGEDETLMKDRLVGASYPAVERIEKRFREENRKRGVQIYTKQKTRESVDQILAALEGVTPPDDIFGDGDPFGEDAA